MTTKIHNSELEKSVKKSLAEYTKGNYYSVNSTDELFTELNKK